MIQPLHDRVLVKRVEAAEMHAGILYIPDAAREKANVGMVVAVGAGKRLDYRDGGGHHAYPDPSRLTPFVKPNETVLFGKYSGHDFEHEGETLLFLREDEILAILEEGEQ